MSGGSTKQLADVRSVHELQGSALDFEYIERWIESLGLQNLCSKIVGDADLNTFSS